MILKMFGLDIMLFCRFFDDAPLKRCQADGHGSLSGGCQFLDHFVTVLATTAA